MIDLDPDEALLTAVRGPSAEREPDAGARARAAELDAGAQPDLRGDRDRGGGPAIERATPHPGRSA